MDTVLTRKAIYNGRACWLEVTWPIGHVPKASSLECGNESEPARILVILQLIHGHIINPESHLLRPSLLARATWPIGHVPKASSLECGNESEPARILD